jgi:hypothetical protein
MERYIDPGKENAWRLPEGSRSESRTGWDNLQEVSEDIGDKDAERIYIAIFLEEMVQILELRKRLWYTQQRAVLSESGDQISGVGEGVFDIQV